MVDGERVSSQYVLEGCDRQVDILVNTELVLFVTSVIMSYYMHLLSLFVAELSKLHTA